MLKQISSRSILLVLLAVFGAACHANDDHDTAGDVYDQAAASLDRPSGDRPRDASRKPAEIFRFIGLQPGMTVLELGAGGGYTTEFAARVVGPDGAVYVQGLDKQSRAQRLSVIRPLEKHILWELRSHAEKAGLQAGQADAVLAFFTIHDMYLNKRIDKARLYGDVLHFLRPGGVFVVLDNAAEPGSGLRDTKSLHRIGEEYVIREIEQAGFKLVRTSDLLRNVEDDHSGPWSQVRPRGFHDRFSLVFEKPAQD